MSRSTERERLPMNVAICNPVIAAVLRGVSSRYEFAIGSLCAGLFWDALAAHLGVEQRRCQWATGATQAGPDALIPQGAKGSIG